MIALTTPGLWGLQDDTIHPLLKVGESGLFSLTNDPTSTPAHAVTSAVTFYPNSPLFPVRSSDDQYAKHEEFAKLLERLQNTPSEKQIDVLQEAILSKNLVVAAWAGIILTGRIPPRDATTASAATKPANSESHDRQ